LYSTACCCQLFNNLVSCKQQPAAPAGDASLVPQNETDLAAAGTDAGPSKVNVQFVVPEYLTHWGQVLKVVGSQDELGNWKVEKVRSSIHQQPSHSSN
jgi:hypothetical protein